MKGKELKGGLQAQGASFMPLPLTKPFDTTAAFGID